MHGMADGLKELLQIIVMFMEVWKMKNVELIVLLKVGL